MSCNYPLLYKNRQSAIDIFEMEKVIGDCRVCVCVYIYIYIYASNIGTSPQHRSSPSMPHQQMNEFENIKTNPKDNAIYEIHFLLCFSHFLDSISDVDAIITSTTLSLYPLHSSSIKISSFLTSGW